MMSLKTSEAPDNSDRDNSQSAPNPGRLRITHLLVWTTLCGVVMGLRLAWIRANVQPELITNSFLCFQAFISVIHGAALSGLVLLVWRWSHGSRTFPTQPGHWLLLFVAACVIDDYLAGLLAKPVFRQVAWFQPSVNWYWYPWNAQAALVGTLGGATNLVFLIIMRRAHLWRLVLIVTCLTFCTYGAFFLLLMLGKLPYNLSNRLIGFSIALAGCAAALYSLLVATLGDRRSRTPRDWFHWAGIATLATALLACLADQIRLLTF